MGGHCAQYIALRHLYITSFALRCADGTEKAPVLGSIYLKSKFVQNCRKLKQMAFFTKKNGG